MKKILVVILCLTLMLGCVPAFAQGGADGITEIVWQWPSPGGVGAGFQAVEDALNAMMEKDIGVRLRLEPVGLMESQNEAVLMVSAGEQLDIMLSAFNSIGPVVDSGLIVPLDDLLDKYGQAIKEHCGAALLGCSYGLNIYGVPTAFINSVTYGFAIRKDMCDKYGITIDQNKKYTVDDLSEIFAKVKAGEGDNYYCTIPWNTTDDPANNSYIEYDRIGGRLACGVLMLNRSFEDLTVTNLFATEEYKNYAQTMYDWAQKGYISPDAAVTSEVQDALLRSGNYLGMFYWDDPMAAVNLTVGTGIEFVTLPMLDSFVPNNGGSVIQWSIPITSANSEKAMQALNYIYEHKEAAWMFQFGLEGQSYEVLEQTEFGPAIKYLAEDTSTLPYFQPYGIYGDRLEWPTVKPEPVDKNKILKDFDKAVPQSRYSPALGYSFVQTNVSTEVAAVTTVISQYAPSINSGALDPAKALPEFLAALEASGINKIIEENQKQLNEWAAAK